MVEPRLFDTLGGESELASIVDEVVGAVVADEMIGFLFRQVDKARLKKLEYQHAARLLGADIAYEGRRLDAVHSRHRIQGGQFDRRMQILRNILDARDVPVSVRARWLEHTVSLRGLITSQECL